MAQTTRTPTHSLHVNNGQVQVFTNPGPIENNPAEMSEQEACRRILAHDALTTALADLLRETDNGTQLCAAHFVTDAQDALALAKGNGAA